MLYSALGGGIVDWTPAMLGADLLAEYRMDEGSGLALLGRDSSGLSPALDGALGLSGGFIPSWAGGGLAFSTSLVQLPPSLAPLTKSVLVVASTPFPVGGTNTVGCYIGADSNDHFLGQDVDGKPVVWGTYANSVMAPSERQRGVLAMVFNFNDASPTFYYGGREALGYQTLAQTSWAASTKLWLGLNPTGGGVFFGTMYYAMLFRRALSAGEASAACAYAGRQVAARGVSVGNIIPASRDFLVGDCDSLTYGYGAFAPSPGGYLNQLAAALSNPIEITNLGVGGQRADTCAAAGPARVDVLWPGRTGKKVYLLWPGVNDINQSRSPAATYGSIAERADAALAAGADYVFMGTPIPIVSSNPAYEADRQALASLIRAGVDGRKRLLDFGASGNGIGSAGDNFGPNYYLNIHLNNAGYAIAASIALTGLAAVGVT